MSYFLDDKQYSTKETVRQQLKLNLPLPLKLFRKTLVGGGEAWSPGRHSLAVTKLKFGIGVYRIFLPTKRFLLFLFIASSFALFLLYILLFFLALFCGVFIISQRRSYFCFRGFQDFSVGLDLIKKTLFMLLCCGDVERGHRFLVCRSVGSFFCCCCVELLLFEDELTSLTHQISINCVTRGAKSFDEDSYFTRGPHEANNTQPAAAVVLDAMESVK